jgi:hypothetical protein
VLELAGTALYVCVYLTLGRLLGPTLARAPLTLALFYGLLALVIALPSLLLWLRVNLRLKVHQPSTAKLHQPVTAKLHHTAWAGSMR